MVGSRGRVIPAAVLVLAVGAGLLGEVGGAVALEPVAGAGASTGPFVDVALVGAAARGADRPSSLLVVRPPDVTDAGTLHVARLDPGDQAWTEATRIEVATGLDAAGPARFVPLGDGVALVASDERRGLTFVGLLRSAGGSVALGPTGLLALGRVGVGAADVDGDGTTELVLAGDSPSGGIGHCTSTTIVVMNGDTLATRTTATLREVGLAGAAIGRFGAAGDDLIAYTRTTCGADAVPQPRSVIAVDLRDGAPRLVLPSNDDPAVVDIGPHVPLVVDIDRDGTDEAIVRQGPATVVVDPAQDWRGEIVDPNAIPLAVVDGDDQPRLAIETPAVEGEQARVGLLSIGRVRPGGEIVRRGLTAVTALVPRTRPGTVPGIELATDPGAPPPAWVGDLDGSGCVDVLLPAATFQRCADDPDRWSGRSGPAWLQTAPLLGFGAAGDRRLLVAAGVGWATSLIGLAVPHPAASAGHGLRWWPSPSSPFILEVVRAADVRPLEPRPARAVTIDPAATGTSPAQMRLSASRGDRLFVRLVPADGGQPPSTAAGTPRTVPPDPQAAGEYLRSAPVDDYGRVGLVAVPDGVPAGAAPGSVLVPLPGDTAAPGGSTDWNVSAVGLDGLGAPSTIVAGLVRIDRVGPVLDLEAPILSMPWPLETTIRGSTEPGSQVRAGDDRRVVVGTDGSFGLAARLAPWPQDVRLESIDAAGNVSRRTFSLVGGVDYRQLPWQALVVGGVLLTAAFTTWGRPRFRRRRGPPVPSRAEPGDRIDRARGVIPDAGLVPGTPLLAANEAEIEDLPSRGGPG